MTCPTCGLSQEEHEGAIEMYGIESSNRRRAEREVARLKRELNGSTTKESQKVRAVCDYHDERWRALNPKAKGLDYPMDGLGAATVRKWIRRGKDVEWIKRAIDGAFASEFHRKKPSSYLTLKSLLGDEDKTYRHHELMDKLEAPKPVVVPVSSDAAPLPSEAQLAAWADDAQGNEKLLARVMTVKGWTGGTLHDLGIGFDGDRLILPIRDAEGVLVSVGRYLPNGMPKMLAPKGRWRDLFPAPETHEGDEIWVVEGEPDAVTAFQLGLPAVGVPGAQKWAEDWTPRVAAKRVVLCFDCDEPGRAAAERVRADLASLPDPCDVRVLDLDPARSDGFDLTDFVLAGGTVEALRALVARPSLRIAA